MTTTETAALLAACIAVESGGNDMALGDNGRAVGALQIHREMVADVNRIAGTRYQWPADCHDRAKASEMWLIYMSHYCATATQEQAARRWNGGPSGGQKKSTERYWRKIQRCLTN